MIQSPSRLSAGLLVLLAGACGAMAQVTPQCYMWEQPPIGWSHDARFISMVRVNVLDMTGTQAATAVTGQIATRLTANTLDTGHVIILLQNFGQDAVWQDPVTNETIVNTSMSLLHSDDHMTIASWPDPDDEFSKDDRRQLWMNNRLPVLTSWMNDFITGFKAAYVPTSTTTLEPLKQSAMTCR